MEDSEEGKVRLYLSRRVETWTYRSCSTKVRYVSDIVVKDEPVVERFSVGHNLKILRCSWSVY